MSSPTRSAALGLVACLSSGCGLLIEPSIPWSRPAPDLGVDAPADAVLDAPIADIAIDRSPDVPTPDAPADVPSVDALDVPSAPDVVDVLDADAPDAPDAPDAFDATDVPDVSPFVDVPDAPDVPDVCVPAPRLKFPLSGSVVTTTQPTLRWVHASCGTPIQIQVCRNRACTDTHIVDTPSVPGTYRIPVNLQQARTYFWRIRYGAGLTSSTPLWTLRVPQYDVSRPRIATAWGRFHDGNGDGYADLVVGVPVPTRLGPVSRQGSVLVWRGGPFFTSLGSPIPVLDPPLTISPSSSGPDAARGFGALVSSASDVNGDGLGDLLIASRNGEAAVWLSNEDGGGYVRAPGYTVSPTLPPTSRPVTLPAIPATGLGDFDGDGYADVAYTHFDPGGANAQINLTFGGARSAAGAGVIINDFAGGRVPGFTLVAGGDINGDGRADLISGEPGRLAGASLGRVVVYLGNESRSLIGRPIEVSDPSFGAVVAGGMDVDGDGRADVVTLTATPQMVRVYGWDVDDSRLVLRQSLPLRDEFTRITSAGDVDGDGNGDVLAWSPDGVQQLLLGGAAGLTVANGARYSTLASNIAAVACAGPLDDRVPGTVGDDLNAVDDLVTVWLPPLLPARASSTRLSNLSEPDGGVRWLITEGRPLTLPGDVEAGVSVASAW